MSENLSSSSENLSSGRGSSQSSENLAPPPSRQPRRVPDPFVPGPSTDDTKQTGPITSDDMKLKKSVTVNKPIVLKPSKKKD